MHDASCDFIFLVWFKFRREEEIGMGNEKILVINPGSTSTKVAVYEGDQQKWVESISHSLEELKNYACVYDQLEMRTDLVRECLQKHGDTLESLTAIVSRGGNMPPVRAGAYEINGYMVDCLHYHPGDEHASNLGAGIAYQFAQKLGIKAYTYDAVTVDELLPVASMTGLKGIPRQARGHSLNTRAAALAFCRQNQLEYADTNLIVAHLGGGITINLHSGGKMIDMVMDQEGPFSPERAGGLPTYTVVELAYSGAYTRPQLMKKLQRTGGLIAYFGTADLREVEALIDKGDSEAALVVEAMALAIAKSIAKLAPTVNGKVDYILLTGGLAYSKRLTQMIRERVSFLAPIVELPGENEMQALANGALRVLRGEENAHILTPDQR